MRLLLIEDDNHIARELLLRWRDSDRLAQRAATLAEADAALAQATFDIVLLDLGLPDGDGMDWLTAWRARDPHGAVLVMTARDRVADRVRGLRLGADDYLVKPFALSELVARSRALVRRNQARGGSVLSLGNLRMDLEARRAYIGEQELALAGREWSILQFMLSRTGKIVAKEQIIAAISNWDGTTSDNAIEVHVSRLRSKLEPAGLKIRTIRGFGYLLEEA